MNNGKGCETRTLTSLRAGRSASCLGVSLSNAGSAEARSGTGLRPRWQRAGFWLGAPSRAQVRWLLFFGWLALPTCRLADLEAVTSAGQPAASRHQGRRGEIPRKKKKREKSDWMASPHDCLAVSGRTRAGEIGPPRRASIGARQEGAKQHRSIGLSDHSPCRFPTTLSAACRAWKGCATGCGLPLHDKQHVQTQQSRCRLNKRPVGGPPIFHL